MKPLQKPSYLSSFGRNRGRSLSDRQQALVDDLLPRISVEIDAQGKAILPENYAHRILEIGFGGGEHLVALAQHKPESLLIGCEPFINGVAKALCAIEECVIQNIRLFSDDARILMAALPEKSVEEAYILFPDPWPKLRHNKRRLVNQETLSMLARIQPQGASLLIATDHHDYATWILEQLYQTPYFDWKPQHPKDWHNPPSHWVQTKYERKTSEQGRAPMFFACTRTEIAHK